MINERVCVCVCLFLQGFAMLLESVQKFQKLCAFVTGHSQSHAPFQPIGMNTNTPSHARTHTHTHTLDLHAEFQPPRMKSGRQRMKNFCDEMSSTRLCSACDRRLTAVPPTPPSFSVYLLAKPGSLHHSESIFIHPQEVIYSVSKYALLYTNTDVRERLRLQGSFQYQQREESDRTQPLQFISVL